MLRVRIKYDARARWIVVARPAKTPRTQRPNWQAVAQCRWYSTAMSRASQFRWKHCDCWLVVVVEDFKRIVSVNGNPV